MYVVKELSKSRQHVKLCKIHACRDEKGREVRFLLDVDSDLLISGCFVRVPGARRGLKDAHADERTFCFPGQEPV